MSVDVAVVENVTSGAGLAVPAGGVFPADGVFVEVREGETWAAGWLVADRTEVAALSVNRCRGGQALVCRWFDVVRLGRDPDMWVDDEGAIVADAQVNLMATAIARRPRGDLAAVLRGRGVRGPRRQRSHGGPV